MNDVFDGVVPSYAIPVALGILLAACFPASKQIADPVQKRKYRILQLFTLVGAIIGAKLSVLMGDLRWPQEPLPGYQVVLTTGRSITGGLILGFLTAELLKPVESEQLTLLVVLFENGLATRVERGENARPGSSVL